LLEYFQPLAAEAVIELHEAGDVSAGMGEALHKPRAYGINGRHKYNRHSVCRLQHWSRSRATGGNNYVRSSGQQFGGMLADIGGVRSGAVNIEFQVLAFKPAKGAQFFPNGPQSALVVGVALYCFGDENGDAPHAI
jgi:hypothetical protein